MASAAAGGAIPELLFGRRGIAKVVHVWLPVGVFLSTAATAHAATTLRATAGVLLAAGCFAQVCILANDLFDRREDEAAGKERWIGRLPIPGAAALLALIAALGGAALAFAGGKHPSFVIYAVSLALGLAYSAPPLRLKVRGMAGPAAYAAATAAAYALLPGVALGATPGAAALLFAVVFLDKAVHLLHHQITDHDADLRGGAMTFAVVAGSGRTRSLLRCAAWSATLSFAAVPLLLLRSGSGWTAGAAMASTFAGLAAAALVSRGDAGVGASFARELPPLYLGLGFSTVRVLPALLLAGAAAGRPLLWPICLAALATAATELASYGPLLRADAGRLRQEGAAAAAGLVFAIGLRVLHLHDKPFWRDELWVAELSREGLPAILATAKPTPVGFALLLKLCGRVGELLPGVPPEISLRLVPLLCGVAAVAALPRLARALGAPPAVSVTALLLAAGAPPLVYYSRELKHYGVDLLLAILVPLFALRFFGRAEASSGRTAGGGGRSLSVALLAAPWISFASVFPIAGTLAWGWLQPWRRAASATRRRWLALTLLYALSFASAHTIAMQRQAESPRLNRLWERELTRRDALPLAIQAGSAASDSVRVTFSYFFPGLELIALPLAALGLAAWTGTGALILRLLAVSTLSLTVVAVLADRYVVAQGRLLLFAAPLLLLCVASGLATLGRLLKPAVGARVAAAAPLAAGAIAALSWGGAAIAHRLPPYRNDVGRYFRYDILHDVEPLIAAAERLADPSEPVLVSFGNWRAFRWHAGGRLPGATVLSPPRKPGEARRILRGWAGERRAWILLLEEEQRFYEGAVARAGLEWSLAATARGSRLWELRPAGSFPRAPAR